MREWQLTADHPLAMRFAADVRLGTTDYTDDQSWEIIFGGPQEPALAFVTRYGGRTGIARLVPMFVLDGRSIYEGHSLAEQPTLRAFVPNYALVTARLLDTLELTAELWVMDSQAVGGRFTLQNHATQPVTLRLDLFAQLVRDSGMIDMNLLGLDNGGEALHLGKVANLNPILLVEGSKTAAGSDRVRPKLSATLTIPAGGRTAVRWIHAGNKTVNDSLQTAFQWLYKTDWDAAIRQIEQLDTQTPIIITGNQEWDTALAFSEQVALRSFVGPTNSLPYPSFVSARIPARGFSPRGDGSDHGWQWSGQTAALSYLVVPTMAILSPDLARGVIRNALATRRSDGWIDFKPGLAGQRANMLSLPLLAAATWRVYEVTEDKTFLNEVFPSLLSFFERWFQPDMDRDQDGIPEWGSTTQSGYDNNPLFARFQRSSQNADISNVIAADLLAYLIMEGRSLIEMARTLDNAAAITAIQNRVDKLTPTLESLWNEVAGTYLYRDRETGTTPKGATLFQGKGDEAFSGPTQLDPANRLIVRVVGGKDQPPRVSAVIEGVDFKGKSVNETLAATTFSWHYGMGAAVSEHVYSKVNYVKIQGLSRVYNIEIDTVDLTRDNQTLLLPLWAGVPTKEQAARLIQTITDPARYWRAFGMPVLPANDPVFKTDNSAAVWWLWNSMIIEGLLDYGYTGEAATLFSRLLDGTVRALRRDHAFHETYNSDIGDGFGDLDELAGLIPIGLVMRLIGLRIVSPRKVWAGGVFALSTPVKVDQSGVTVTRSAEGTTVRFPSGYTAEVGPEWQLIEDSTPVTEPPQTASTSPQPPAKNDVIMVDTPTGSQSAASMIPVKAQKDDTMEIQISQIDFTPDQPSNTPQEPPSASTPGTVKIPVRGDNE